MQPWIMKYTPKALDGIYGQDDAVVMLKNLLDNFTPGKAILLWGPIGTGKTSSVIVYAKEHDLDILELNASDIRNKKNIQDFLDKATGQMSLFGKGKIILIDEVDGLSGIKDRGGIAALVRHIKGSGFPIVATCKNPYDKKLSALKKVSHLIEFDTLQYTDIFKKLKDICRHESVEFDEKALKTLSRRAGGDMRAAINDLQSLATDRKLNMEDLEGLSDRQQKDTLKMALLRIFKTTNIDIARTALDNIDDNLDNVMMWLDENLPYEYKIPEDLARAYDMMSKADVYKGRIRRWQHWRFLVYMNALLTSGIAVSKDDRYRSTLKLKESKRALKIWIANMKYMKRKGIAEKIASHTHASAKDTIQNVLPYIMPIFRTRQADEFERYFELEKDEMEWLKKAVQ